MTHVDGGGVPAGTQLNGIYEIVKRIAMGGMGEVYIGQTIATGDKVAIKMILPEHANNDIILDLFRKEASTLHNLYHEAIVRYYLFSVDPVLNRPYMVMEFAGGPDLTQRLREGGPLGEAEMDTLRPRIAGGLHAAHKLGIIHRDISPDNVILVDGQVEKAKIIDFGIAKSTSSEGTLIGSGFAGKLNYVSPEQLGLEGGDVTGKSDIYSLGLVFAEAVIGRPLPMGGSQVEVIDKRRTIPDLSQVPEFIRPLIEAMIQPSPVNRPSDMDEVAKWSRAGADPGAAPVSQVAHPRDRRRPGQQEQKKGFPWLWLGLGGGAVAAAGVAAFVFLGQPDVPGPGGRIGLKDPTPGTDTGLNPGTDQPAKGTLAAASPSTQASNGRVGETYAWTSDAFAYGGNLADLTLSLDGALPRGLAFQNGADGRARIYGTPEEAGDFSFAIAALSPEGDSASQQISLSVEEARVAIASPVEPVVPSTGGDDGQIGSTAPTVPTGVPGGLTPPSQGENGAGTISSGGDSTLVPVTPTTPGQLGSGGDSGGSALSGSPITSDPGDNLTEPTVATGLPGGLTPPGPTGGDAGVGGGDSGGSLVIPRTGGAAPQPTPSSGGGTQLANIPTPENGPPTIQNPRTSLEAQQGQDVNVALGELFDEEGPDAVELRVEGRLPNGMQIRKAPGGVIQLYGAPTDFGQFDVKVAAVDPQGLVSRSENVRIDVMPQSANPAVRDYILGYNGGQCFLSRPMELGPKLAQIEVFAAEIPPVVTFDSDFKRDQGFEANIGLRLITDAQCALVNALDQVGPQALDNSLQIRLVKDELASGDRLRGTIVGGDGAKFFLFDNTGGITDLTGSLQTDGAGTTFDLPLHADGPQILIAARPGPGSGMGSSAGLEELLGAAQRGQASLGLGFIIVRGS